MPDYKIKYNEEWELDFDGQTFEGGNSRIGDWWREGHAIEMQSDGDALLRETPCSQDFEKPCIPYRYLLVAMSFFGFFNAFTSRFCFNIALVAMVNYSTPVLNGTSNECVNIPDLTSNSSSQSGGEFDWGSDVQSVLLAAFFYGYFVTQLPGGYLAERIGAKLVFGMAVFLPSVISIATPFVARWNVKLLVALRICMGLTEGPLFPSYYALLGVWAPPAERTRLLLLSTIGAPIGTVVGQSLTGYFCSLSFLGGWPLPFYFFGTIGIVWFVVWTIFGKSRPEEHSRLSQYERYYLMTSLQHSGKNITSQRRPWLKILFSRPTIALYIYDLFDGICFNAFISGMPIYLHQILKFDISQNGVITALPNIGQAVVAALSAAIADWLRTHHLTTAATRKLLTFIAEGSLVCFTLGMGFVDCNRVAAVTLYFCSTIAMGIGGGGAIANPLDIAPAYAGTVFGIMNVFGNAGGFISPMLIGYVTNDSTNSREWSIVFFGMSACYAMAALVFLILGKGEEQPWSKHTAIEEETQPIVYSIQDTGDAVDMTTAQRVNPCAPQNEVDRETSTYS